ncbi:MULTISPECIES: D-alanine--D-alanine ligase [unclassified Apibacter]|uniref:D-alanine--D-alanine ligase n=1 Tax=unclassified Apibacter TaxID=2630820 RepID=UPI001321CB86|nr:MULTISPECIES: D-alanine--D-alanine ligase [unclassified Apibacter]MCX8676165.1 D-alanine--D-alanine ligase [Apibacter sp. B3919]MXO25291.1 D-alanine--D-alanine ligase [Apibacter sp. B3924]MXO26685.1 D-alanine--D-alanine ligase [Apibacter sp. B3813]MXO29414.1 D-alanine--D-alanine ligase [Apibacter sp. B3913]MXO30963.1 D-alanine--D-alanine ligase [Apibacter sp. B3912]
MTVGIVMGGYSEESNVSLKSGDYFYSQINKSKYTVFKITILKDGWNVIINDQSYPINKGDFSFQLNEKKIHFDVLLNTIHGNPGENGLMQAYWELLNIPYSGCSFYNSALTFNKRDTLSVLKKFNVSVANSVYLNKGDHIDVDSIIEEVGLPCFVKPNQSGSSLGVSKVKKKEDFLTALDFAFKEDKAVLIESYLEGREVQVGVFKNQGEVVVVNTTEIISKNEFFDYEAKYLGASEEITPAPLSDEEDKRIREAAAHIYRSLDMTGFSRLDFIIVNGTPYFLEINTTPGCSPASIFPQQVKQAGLDFSELLDNEISIALQRFENK